MCTHTIFCSNLWQHFLLINKWNARPLSVCDRAERNKNRVGLLETVDGSIPREFGIIFDFFFALRMFTLSHRLPLRSFIFTASTWFCLKFFFFVVICYWDVCGFFYAPFGTMWNVNSLNNWIYSNRRRWTQLFFFAYQKPKDSLMPNKICPHALLLRVYLWLNCYRNEYGSIYEFNNKTENNYF